MHEQTAISPETRLPTNTERISAERVSLTTRVLLGPQALLTNEPLTATVSSDTLRNLGQSMQLFEEKSLTESAEFWSGKVMNSYDGQKKLWSTQMERALLNNITQETDETNDEWKRIYTNCGIDTDITPETVTTIYDTYFAGTKREDNLTRFIGTVIDSYTTDSQTDYEKLQADMDKITWIATMFGERTSHSIPSLIEATLAEKNQDIVQELIMKATIEEHGHTRMNRLSMTEAAILAQLRKESQAPLQEESEPRTQKAGIVIRKDQLVTNNMKKIKLPIEGTEMYAATIAEQLIDVSSGESKNNTINLLPEHQRFLHDIQQTCGTELIQSMERHSGTLVLSPVAWGMLDMIASSSHETNKELGFTIQGVSETHTTSGNELFVATHIVPAHDYTTAQTHVADMRDRTVYEKNASTLAKQTGLEDFFRLEAQRTHTKDMQHGEVLFTIHTHQEQLGSKFTATPSPEDEQAVKKILRNPTVHEYTWGIVTKASSGDLHLAFFRSLKDEQGKIHHHRVAVVSPDLTTVQTMPNNAFGEASTPISLTVQSLSSAA